MFLIAILIFLQAEDVTSEDRVYTISSYVGNVIDAVENEYYDLFGFEGFESATFLKMDDRFMIVIQTSDTMITLSEDPSHIDSLKRKIEDKGPMPKAYSISPLVGEMIDAKENEYYGLFDLKGFRSATVVLVGERFMILLQYEDTLITKYVDEPYLDSLKGEIEEKGPMRTVFRRLIRDPNTTRLFIMPTGQTLKKGRSYIANYELFLFWFSTGLADNLMVSFGGTIFPVPGAMVFYFGPKLKLYDSGRGHALSVGAHIFGLPFVGFENNIWAAGYTCYSIETGASCYTIGAGTSTLPFFKFSGVYGGLRTGSRNVKLLLEYLQLFWHDDYSGTETIGNLIAGVRFTSQNMSADLGLLYHPAIPDYFEIGWVLGFPVVNFVYNF